MDNKELPKKHSDFVKLAILDAQKKYPLGRWFQRDVGLFKTIRNTPIKIGIKGQSDIYGFVPYGDQHVLWVEIEVKLPHDKLSKYQVGWKKTVTNLNGLFIELRSFSDTNEIQKEINRRSL